MKKVVLIDIDDVLFKTGTFIKSGLKRYELYKDALKTIQTIKKLADVAILSKGEYNLQLDKLNKTKLLDFFKKEHLFIVDNKDEAIRNVLAKFENREFLMVDDRIDNLKLIKKTEPKIKTVLIKRGRYKNLVLDFQPDFIVDNLSQVLKLLC